MVDGKRWRYYRLGDGAPVLWLTGGLRRASFAFAFLERLATGRTVIAPDFSPVRTVREFFGAFDAILRAERIDTFALVGQSYGGFLAQAYLVRRAVDLLSMGQMGHTAALFDPDRYVGLLEQALG